MKIPILIYHRIVTDDHYDNLSSEQDKIYSIRVNSFDDQIRYLHEKGFQTLRLEQVFHHIKKNDSFPRRSVAITFDDGLNSQYELACPILRKYGFTATFFITTDKSCPEFISGKYQDHPLTESQIKQIDCWGFDIGSHTHTHANLKDLDRGRVYNELSESKRILEGILGKKVSYLSVPGGYYSNEVKEISRLVGYDGICISKGRVGENHKDPFVIRRLGIKGYYSIDLFDKLISEDKAVVLKNRIELTSKYIVKNAIGINNYVRLRNYLIRLKAW